MDLSLIIPCFNEQDNVRLFFDESQKVFKNSGIKYEYVFVNDGSSDKTQDNLDAVYAENLDTNITLVEFSRNFGKESAIFAGLQNCSGDYICIIDADLQQRPETAFEMFRFITNNRDFDCVCAYQNVRSENKLVSFLKSAFYKTMNIMTETELKNGASDFRLFNTKVRDAILSLGEYHRFSKGIFSWVGFNVHYMEYKAQDRNAGDSKWSLWSLIKYAFTGIIAFSTAPLKFAIYIGSGATLFSVVYLIITIIRKLTSHINVDGFTQLVILITFFAGITLVILGIIGEYIAKIYQQVKNRPIYIAKNIKKRNDR